MDNKQLPNKNLSSDPIDGASKDHPIGTGIGAVGGAIAGATLGSALGPMGSLTGAMVGTVAGAIAGKGIAEKIDPDAEEGFWRENFHREHYYKNGASFDDYGPAYRLGLRRYSAETSFEAAQPALEKEWPIAKESSNLDWEDAKHATRASWDRIHHTFPKK